jgi:predicted dehydrogenase
MSEPLRLGVVGVAGMGQAHLFAGSLLEEYELAAVCDIADGPRGKAAADFDVPGFATPAELYRSGLVDAVAVATPPATHFDLVTGALDAGLHVYCEKPLVPTAARGRALADRARAAGRVVQVGLQHRFLRAAVAAHELVAGGGLGDVFRVELTATHWFRSRRYFDAAPWRGTWSAAGGGVLMSQAIHQIDSLVWLAGLPCRVTACARRARHAVEVEDDVVALLEYPDGARGTLAASTAEPVGADALSVSGELGRLSLEGFRLRRARIADGTKSAQELTDTSTETEPAVSVEWADVVEPAGSADAEWFDMVLDCHRDFAAAIARGHPPRIPVDEGLRVIELVNALYLSAARGEPVTLPIDGPEYEAVFEQLATGALELPR